MLPTTYSATQKFRTRTDNNNSSNLSFKVRKNHPKVHSKNRTFAFFIISKDRMCHILYSRVESSENVGFQYDGSSVIVDNSANAHI